MLPEEIDALVAIAEQRIEKINQELGQVGGYLRQLHAERAAADAAAYSSYSDIINLCVNRISQLYALIETETRALESYGNAAAGPAVTLEYEELGVTGADIQNCTEYLAALYRSMNTEAYGGAAAAAGPVVTLEDAARQIAITDTMGIISPNVPPDLQLLLKQ